MTTTRHEQLTLLASHISQQAGIIETITRIILAKDDGSMDAYVADSKIAYWKQHADAQQRNIDDCLRNIAELDGNQPPPYEAKLVDVAELDSVDSSDPASIILLAEPTIVDDDAPAPKRGRKASQS